MNAVAVIGLGQMGTTLARLLLGKGHEVHVWNRTPSKAQPLIKLGATPAASAAAAIQASRIVVMCVHDYAAVDEILQGEGVQAALAGRLLIQLTTGSPQDARNAQDRAAALGAAADRVAAWSPLMKTPGPSLAQARDRELSFFLSDRFAGEAIPASTAKVSLAAVVGEVRVVGRFVMTLFRNSSALGES